MNEEVRVRFAPSPTGPQHIGGIRTAIYNYLFAKKHKGSFILRIEDTDQKRYVPGSEEYLINALNWLGIKPDEGFSVKGGEYGPYRQSERKHIYAQHIKQLLDAGYAYYAFDTPEEIELMKKRLRSTKSKTLPQYNTITRETMINSLTLPKEEVESKIRDGYPFVIRLKVPRNEEIKVHDIIRGWVKVDSSTLDDKVLIKSDGLPTYHFANVVDDYLMKITHVIRGEEWLPSAPIHVLLYKYMGWSSPSFAHLPLLLKPDGIGKLSKREADIQGYPVFPLSWHNKDTEERYLGFCESGYLPEALVNFLSFLGWNPKNGKEIFNIKELIRLFELENVSKSGVKFDINKAKWYNQQYIKALPLSKLVLALKSKLDEKSLVYDEKKLNIICEQIQERLIFIKDIYEESIYFFNRPASYDESVINKKWNTKVKSALIDFKECLHQINSISLQSIKQIIEEASKKADISYGKVIYMLRLLITGKTSGPDLSNIILILEKEETINRLDIALKKLN